MTGRPVPISQLQPVSGLPVVFGRRPTVVVFVRDLHGTSARVAIARLGKARQALDAAGVDMAIVTRTDLEYARDYVPRHHVLIPLMTDEDGRLRALFEIGRDKTGAGTLLALRPATVRAWADGLNLGRDLVVPNGDLGGEFVIDAQGTIVYARAFAGALDLPDVAGLSERALSAR